MKEEKWISWIFLISSFGGILTFYQADENDNITISWDIQSKADVSRTDMICIFLSDVIKVLYHMINGVEDSESQHQQFAGRVEFDRDALRRGRVTLHVSTVTAEDSGSYQCDLAAEYDNIRKQWRLEASERFVLNVTQTSEGGNSGKSMEATTAGVEHRPQSLMKKRENDLHLAVIMISIFALLPAAAVAVLAACSCQRKR